MTESFQDGVIARYAKGLSFLDMGGLWGTKNEKVTVAARAGAASLAMADMQVKDNDLWQAFRAHAADLGLDAHRYASFPDQNLDDLDIGKKIGTYEFVHCAGILYHAPNPMFTLERLADITEKYLLIGSMVAPDVIETPHGNVSFTGGRLIHIPSVDAETKAILASFFDSTGLKIVNINTEHSEPYRIDGKPNYGPWWWLYNGETLQHMLRLSGFEVLEVGTYWDDRVCYVFCRKEI